MALSNFKQMISGSGFISDGISGFFTTWKKMKDIKKIKESHDYAWYNEYLKTSKKLREFFLQECNRQNISIIPVESLSECDADMLRLYFDEIYVSHNVTYQIDEDERVYVIKLTNEYIFAN